MNISYIKSKDNDQIKKVVSLHSQKGRNEHNLFFAEGIRACTTLLERPFIEPKTLYICLLNPIDAAD